MFRVLAGLVLGSLLCGCVSQQTVPVDPAATRRFAGMTIMASKRARPDFMAGTPGQGLIAALGIPAMVPGMAILTHIGNGIVIENEIADPADYISSTLIAELSQKYGLTPIANDGIFVVDESPGELAKQFATSRFLLDVRTVAWGFMNHPVKWSHFGVNYSGRLRVIDTESGKVIAESYCTKQPFAERPDLTRDELLADRAQRLKDELRAAAEFCIAEFRAHALTPSTEQPPVRS